MKLGLIGAGNMASALARGIGEPVLVHDVDDAEGAGAGRRARRRGGRLERRAGRARRRRRALPQAEQLEEVAAAGRRPRRKVVVSILAATPTDAARAPPIPARPVYRFIPNIPAEVSRGVLCYVAGTRAAEGPEEEILELFGRAGAVIRARRRAADRAGDGADELRAGLHGAGGGDASPTPASRHGLDPDDAMRMVVETMGGTAAVARAPRLRRRGAARARGHARRAPPSAA